MTMWYALINLLHDNGATRLFLINCVQTHRFLAAKTSASLNMGIYAVNNIIME